MPYRRYVRKFRPRYRKKYNNSGNKVAFYAKKAYAGYKFLRGIVNAELFTFDVAANINPSSSGSIIPLSQIAVGNDQFNRTGNSILAKTLYMRIDASINGSATNTRIRCLIVKDMENTGTDPTVTDILQTNTTVSPLNSDHFSRYQVLADWETALSSNGPQTKAIKKFINVNDHIKFTGVNATDIYKNQLYLLVLSSEATNTPSFGYYSRLRYYDN